jgi:hypothetical protein
MGDRANIVTQTQGLDGKPERVYLYGHWSGSHMHATLQSALKKGWRWSDSSYLTRIIFDELTKGNTGGETGFGISASITDNEYPLLVVDVDDQRVRIEDADNGKVYRDYSFKEYVETTLPETYGALVRELKG